MSPRRADAAITGAVLLGAVLPIVVTPPIVWWTLFAAVATALPLLWRRRAPIGTCVVVGAATTVLALDRQLPPLPYGALVCAYTIAASAPSPRRTATLVAGTAAVALSLVAAHEETPYYAYTGMEFATALALGNGTRARRARIEALDERARRLDEERFAAAARERTRIARDMHDVLTHSVGLMLVQADAGPGVVRSDPERAEAIFAAISRTGREAVGQLRQILGVLRVDEQITTRGAQPGIDAVADLVERVRRAGLDATFEQHGDPVPVPSDVGLAAYRIVQESITNTLKHARAHRLRVDLRWSQSAVRVTVSDDGRGADGGDTGSPGYGIIGMRERVAACGGRLRVGRNPDGNGFTVDATLPTGAERPQRGERA
ncbi:hypothetical protein B4N89_46970 [Embleya scabrispora]|uniref:histidine kinase n=1 Tax=Embleya scabrispora TaxID=159449 RepID=A0A1T3NIH2_9ACTN|nr:hypothetical protein B4N89_46970 [Embleya scabrispora]